MAFTHVDLFSGIGGFSLAAEWAGFETVLFCERDTYCQRVLAKHWPEVPCHDDIRSLTADVVRRYGIGRIDLLTGGFPCQPFSNAGQRRGAGDDRYLWPEMRRVIRETKPAWIVGENVAGFIGMALDNVCDELEGEGYETLPFVFSACGVAAPHARERCFVVAHSDGAGHTERRKGALAKRPRGESAGRDVRFIPRPSNGGRTEWADEPTVCRVDNGIPHRLDRIRALGNAVVPQQAYPILVAIMDQLRASS